MFMDAENKIISTAKTTFTFRATEQVKQITPNMRIVWRGFVHIILSPVIFSDDRAFVSIEARSMNTRECIVCSDAEVR